MQTIGVISLLVLSLVFVLIAVRKIGRFRVEIWQAMVIGALIVLITGQINVIDAVISVNLDVIIFLFGMFIIGEAAVRSGYLQSLSRNIFGKARGVDQLVLLVLLVSGFMSAILMNDTIAIIGTPVVIRLAKTHDISPRMLLLTLAIGVTTGSVLSPIGNPQNLLIVTEGNIENPFLIFIQFLFIPTLLCMGLSFLFLRLLYKSEFKKSIQPDTANDGYDRKLMKIVQLALLLVLIMIILKILLLFFFPRFDFRMTYIAVVGAAPVVLLSSRRTEILRNIDWKTLVFFVAMFVLMASVWNSGVFQDMISLVPLDLTSIPAIMVLSVVLSQFISNVPLVALYLPIFTSTSASTIQLVTLAAGSTIAGNLLILGAASNVIIIQNAEKFDETISFTEFAKIGIPLTICQILVYSVFLLMY